jgi:hypothetical protein
MLPLAALNAAPGPRRARRAERCCCCCAAAYASLHAPRLLGPSRARTPPGACWPKALSSLLFDGLIAFDKTLTAPRPARGRRRRGWPAQQARRPGRGWGRSLARLWPHTAMGGGLALLPLGFRVSRCWRVAAVAGWCCGAFCVWTARAAPATVARVRAGIPV